MRLWWGKSSTKETSTKETKTKTSKESLFETFHRKCKIPSDNKLTKRSSGGSRRRPSDTISEKGSKSRVVSRTTSPSKQVARCQSFIDRPQPLPLPGLRPGGVPRAVSGVSVSSKSKSDKTSQPSVFLPLRRPACLRNNRFSVDINGDVSTDSFSSECSDDSDDPAELRQRSPLATDCESGSRTATGTPIRSMMARDQTNLEYKSKNAAKPANQVSITTPNRRYPSSHVPNLQAPFRGTFCSATSSSLSSPSRSPMRAFGTEQIINSAFGAAKFYPDVPFLGSGHCSSPGSGQNSVGGDMLGQFLWQTNRSSPEFSPAPSPKMTSPGPSSRIQSGAVTPIHPRARGLVTDDGKQGYQLPLPPVTIPNVSSFCHSNSAATSPSRWKKGKLLGRGTFGHVYVGFNSEKGEMCAMKEVTLFSDDAKSKESANQLGQEIALLSRLRHPNIVQYFGSETVGDKLYIYLEYVSGGSIHKLLQEYGQFGETAIRSYTKQILSGLAYLHAKSTIHRDIKGANILVDPNGRVKLADFGMAKHITGKSCPLSFKGSPYWMSPEVIKNTNNCSLAVDIWSLGCTVLEMATGKPPWSQYEGVAAMFKIGNSKDLPDLPDHLSNDGKDFIMRCLQRNPLRRPTAAQLLDHPFVTKVFPLEKPGIFPQPLEFQAGAGAGVKAQRYGLARNASKMESERLAIHSTRVSKGNPYSSEINIPRNVSCPVSPIRSPLLCPRLQQNLNGRLSPSPISSPHAMSGSSTPLTGGGGTTPFRHVNQSIYLQEGFGRKPKPSDRATYACNSPSYTRPKRDIFQGMPNDIFQGMHLGSQIYRNILSNEGESSGNQFGRPIKGDGKSVLADGVSQQLLKEHPKLGTTLELKTCSPSPRHMS